MTTISEQLREIIRQSPVSQAVIARAIGCSPPVLSRFLAGRSISSEMQDKIGKFFNVELKAGEVNMPIYLQKPMGRPSRARKLDAIIEFLTPEERAGLTPEGLKHHWDLVCGQTEPAGISWDLIHEAVERLKGGGE